jgi:sigma-B regulation protein RsbU (phosphoserine phosphatase)
MRELRNTTPVTGTEANPSSRLARRGSAAGRRATREQFRVARAVQQQLFPAAPRVAGFDLGGASYPVEETGGDYFDFIPMGGGCVGIAVGDVSGHGFGPALLMASTRAYLRALARTHTDISELLTTVNGVLADDLADDHFVTLSFAVLDPWKRSLVYASAGHTTGYILNSAGAVKASLTSTSAPLGFLPDNGFPTSGELPLAPGDLILFLTDGITEAQAPDGTAFGSQRALDVVRRHQGESAQQIVGHLYQAVRAFCQDQCPHDDLTAVVTKVCPLP